jgi:heme-degrading monooxygenase HmoA
MILRAWRSFAALTDQERYPHHLLETVRPKLETIPGFRGLYLLRRRDSSEVEYQVLTLWDSMDTIRAFAGATPERAVVEPEAEAVLLRFDKEVQHYEVLAQPADLG